MKRKTEMKRKMESVKRKGKRNMEIRNNKRK